MRRASLLVGLAACGGPSPPAAPAPPPPSATGTAATCGTAAGAVMSARTTAVLEGMPEEQRAAWRGRFSTEVVTLCLEDRWPPSVLACLTAARRESAVDACVARLDEAPRARATERTAALLREMTEKVALDVPEAEVPLGSTRWTELPACDRYLAVVAQYGRCDRVPQQARDATLQSAEAIRQALRQFLDPDVPAEAKAAAEEACAQGEEALRQSAAALGCVLPAK